MSEAESYTSQQASDPRTPPQVLADIAALRADLRPAVAANPSAYPGLLQWLAGLGEPAVDAVLRTRGPAPTAAPGTVAGAAGQPWQGPAPQVPPGGAPVQPYGPAPTQPYGAARPPGGYPSSSSGLGSPPSATAYGSAPGGHGGPGGPYGARPAGQQGYGSPAGQQGYGSPAAQQPSGYQPTGYQPSGYQPTGYQPSGYQPSGAPQPTGGSKKALWITLGVVGVLVLLVAAAVLVWNLVSDRLPDLTDGTQAELEQLYDRCAEGDGQACDDLFLQSPAGSEYEEFGDTCGGRTEGGTLCADELD